MSTQKDKSSLLKDLFGDRKKAIVVANGPSVASVDWDKIQDMNDRHKVLFLATNRISLLFDKTFWRPDIYSCFTSISCSDPVWRQSIDKCLQEEGIFSFVFHGYKNFSKLESFHKNICFSKNVKEHDRHSKIPEDLIAVPIDTMLLKSYSAVVTSFQICDYLDVRQIGIIGQDGYLLDRGENHFDRSYQYEASDFRKANTRIINLHKELKKYFYKKDVSVYNLSYETVLGDLYPSSTLENFIKN